MIAHLPGYEVTPRTRYAVRLKINHECGCVEIAWLTKAKTLAEAQRLFIERRDLLDLGASRLGDGEVYDQKARKIARISYNGRLWSPEDWTPGTKPLAEAPQEEAA
jgi:hypothetical protein